MRAVYVSSATGSTYSGMFKNHIKEGYGILLHPLGKYSGNFVNDAKEGEGTLIFNDASSYNGGFQQNQFHGKGILCTKDKTVFVGDWYKGLKNGQGCETYADGRVYRGGFQDGQRSGMGTLCKKLGGDVIYNGSWLNGIFHGEGMCMQMQPYDDTESSEMSENQKELQYQGLFFGGLRHGYGVLVNECKGIILKGNWHKNKTINGKWRIEYPDGSIYSGDAKVIQDLHPENRDEDFSLLVDLSKPEAPFVHTPTPHGFGALRLSNADVYIGQFKDGKRMGLGSLFTPGGVKLEGNWENDNLVVDDKVSTLAEFSDIHDGSFESK